MRADPESDVTTRKKLTPGIIESHSKPREAAGQGRKSWTIRAAANSASMSGKRLSVTARTWLLATQKMPPLRSMQSSRFYFNNGGIEVPMRAHRAPVQAWPGRWIWPLVDRHLPGITGSIAAFY